MISPKARGVLPGLVLACVLLSTGPAWGQNDQPIYGDALVNGWSNWSWATVGLTNAGPVHGGTRSISVSAAAWQALYLHHDAFSTAGYTDLVFWIHGGATGGQLLLVQALLGGTAQTAVPIPALTAGVWQKISIPLTSLGVAGKPNMDGFWIQDRSGVTKPVFYVDDVTLVAVPPPANVNLTVDATHVVRTIDARHFGVNTGVWDAVFDTPATISLLTEMGNRTLRYPGGSLSNDYHWQTNTTGNNVWQWETPFDKFAHVAVATGAVVFISVNYGSGTPTEAADWVRYANVTKSYGVKYWEIGNENYGSWETDQNTRPHDPVTYASRFKDYYTRMKAVDPTIKVGAVAVTGEDSYANYADHPVTNPRTGQVHNGWTPVMLATLRSLGVTPDFLIHHRYPQGPGGESDAGLLVSSVSWASEAADLRQQLVDYLGAATAAGVELVATENNSVYSSPGKQTTSLVNGLFLADSIGTAMTTEFNGVVWWDLRNDPETGNNNSSALYGWRPYGDYGIVNSANPPGAADRYPTFYVAKLLQYFARPGDRLVSAASDYGLLSAYAARRADGSLTLLVVNKSPSTALNGRIALSGYSPVGPFTVYSYGVAQDEAARTGVGSADVASLGASGAAASFAFTFPAYSVTVLSLAAGSPPPPAFDYTLGNGGSVSVTRGASGATGITATLTAGSAQSVSFSASGLPSGATAGFSAPACNPTCSSTLTISTSASTPVGAFTVVVTGSPLGRATSFTLVVTAPAAGSTLTVSPATTTVGGSVTATWSGIASPTAPDWIGLYVAGAADTSYLEWTYVSCSKTPGAAAAAGSCAFSIPGTLASGSYELRLFSNNSYTRLAVSNALTLTAGPSLAVSPTSATPGGSVTASWAGIVSPTALDWIGLYAAGAANTSYLAWTYVSCSQTPGAARVAGSCAFAIPGGLPAGTYELRLLSNNGYTRLVTSGALRIAVGPSLGVSPTSVTVGGSVTATWAGIASPTALDWIGLYAAGAADTSYLAWTYVSCSQTPGAARAAGSCAFAIPGGLAAGTYELRLLSNNGFTRITTSPALAIH